ncbi:MAG: ATP-binding protein [Sterolibacteriaceae bacterium]|nr:ATP-binding protein [Sterolibacteriaceae bacterium]
MTALTIVVPRLNDAHADFMAMAHIWRQVDAAGDGAEVSFDFSHCGFLQPNAVVFLGGLARMIGHRGGKSRFLVGTMIDRVRVNLLQNGFGHAMGAETTAWAGNSIPYREYFAQDEDAIVQDLRQNWLGRGWLSVSPALADEVIGQMWELFANAFEHSDTPVGVYSCGQYFWRRRILTLAVADFGVGIPSNVRLHLGQPELSAADALRWAFQRGHSTSQRGGPRGVGLDLLKELVRKTNGAMLVYSHDGRAHIDQRSETYENSGPFFEGTLVQIRLLCDDKPYMLSNEAAAKSAAPFF